MNCSVDVAILGAGISGLSVADACVQRKISCAVFDTSEPGAGTSGAPGMLVNAATGRRAKKAWQAEDGYGSIYSLLCRVSQATNAELFEENYVIRPALTQKLSKDFQRSIEKYDWPEGWVKWISKEQVNREYPYINNDFGALLIQNGLTVNGDIFMKACSEYLKDRGMHSFYHQLPGFQFENGKWHITTDSNAQVKADYLVDARGHALTGTDEWDFVPFHNIKGQTATFHYSDPLPLRSSISSLGYMAFMKSKPNELTVGSTYEHDFQTLETDSDGLRYLMDKLERTLPDYSHNFESVNQWSGIRTTVKDRKPVIGPHPHISKLYIIGALGSKGLLLGRYIADRLVGYIFDGGDIDDTISSCRFFKT